MAPFRINLHGYMLSRRNSAKATKILFYSSAITIKSPQSRLQGEEIKSILKISRWGIYTLSLLHSRAIATK